MNENIYINEKKIYEMNIYLFFISHHQTCYNVDEIEQTFKLILSVVDENKVMSGITLTFDQQVTVFPTVLAVLHFNMHSAQLFVSLENQYNQIRKQ